MASSSPTSLPRLRRQLLDWYREQRRDLPWRRTRDPYRIWVSEIMLQQTRVEAVIPYYERFLCRFPDLSTLADAPLEEVLSSWSGLGYYRRARLLHRAAREIHEFHDATFPSAAEQVRALPGIGRYTAGAILSIAFDQAEPILDGNVIRVLCRLFRRHGDPTKQALAGKLWELAGKLVRGPDPGDLNQALMELGALVCIPREPRCESCPVRRPCRGRAAGEVTSLPELPARKELRSEEWAVALARRNGRYLLRQRRGEILLEGLWEFPSMVLPTTRSMAQLTSRHRQQLQRYLRESLGLDARIGLEIHQHRQALSGRSITFRILEVEVVGRARRDALWLFPGQIQTRALTTATRKILEKVENWRRRQVQIGGERANT